MTNIINEQIREKQVIVIDQNGKNLGLMATSDAIRIAEGTMLDLVVMQDKNRPFVCKILDYNRTVYEQKKRDKERKKNQKVAETKTIQLSCNIDVGDFNRKVEKAREELLDGNKVIVTLRLRGRENYHENIGVDVVTRFCDALEDAGSKCKFPTLESRIITAMLEPKRAK